MDLDVQVCPKKMPRKKSKAVPVGNGRVTQDTSGLLDGITLKSLRRIMFEALEKYFDNFYGLKSENSKEMRATRQRLAGLEQDAWQTYQQTPRLTRVRRTLKKTKQIMEIAVLRKRSIPT